MEAINSTTEEGSGTEETGPFGGKITGPPVPGPTLMGGGISGIVGRGQQMS